MLGLKDARLTFGFFTPACTTPLSSARNSPYNTRTSPASSDLKHLTSLSLTRSLRRDTSGEGGGGRRPKQTLPSKAPPPPTPPATLKVSRPESPVSNATSRASSPTRRTCQTPSTTYTKLVVNCKGNVKVINDAVEVCSSSGSRSSGEGGD
jgi:hypothetical protein